MKAGWEAKTLGEVTLKTETVNPLTSPNLEFEYIDVSSVSNTTFQIQQTQRLKGKDAPSRARRLVKTDDVLLATIRPTLRRIALVPDDLDNHVCSTGYAVLRSGPKVVPKYLFYYLFTEPFQLAMEALQKGASYPAVTEGEVRDQPILLPPIPEQQRIVAILDKAFAAIATATANAEKNFQNARAFFDRTRDTEFTQCTGRYGTVRIDTLCESIMDCVNKTAPKVDGPTEYKMVRTTNIRHGRISLSDVYYVTEDVFTQWTRRQQPTKGDVLLTREAPLGELGMIETDDKIFLGQRIVSYRANPGKLDSKFLLFGMQSAELQNQVKAKASGATVQHMRVPDTKTLQFPSVPLSEQQRLVHKLVGLARTTQFLEFLYRRKLAALDELKKSFLHRAFNGDL